MSFKDRYQQYVQGGEHTPFVQFVNGKDGGWFQPHDEAMNLAETMGGGGLITIGEAATLPLGGGEVDGFIAESVEIIPLAYRWMWIDREGRAHKEYAPGLRGKVQVYAAIKALVNDEWQFVGPVVITAKGMASSEVYDAIKAHRKIQKQEDEVQSLLLIHGETVPTGHGSYRSKVEFEVATAELTEEEDALLERLFDEAQEWRKPKAQEQMVQQAQTAEAEPQRPVEYDEIDEYLGRPAPQQRQPRRRQPRRRGAPRYARTPQAA